MISSCRRRSFLSSFRGRRGRSATVALLVSLVAAQLLGAVHFILIPHTVRFVDGEVVQVVVGHDEHAAGAHGNDHSSGEDEDTDTDECRVHALLAQAKIHSFALGAPEVFVQIPFTPDSPAICEDLRGQDKLYRVSPSNSPPPAA